jgi:hypothetical protein
VPYVPVSECSPADPEISAHRAAVRSHEPSEAELRNVVEPPRRKLDRWLDKQRDTGGTPFEAAFLLCPLLPHGYPERFFGLLF